MGGYFKDGQWVSKSTWDNDSQGEFKRGETTFREFVTTDSQARFQPAAGRYHLYVSYACPWAHRTLITRALMGLEEVISISVVNHFMGDEGWTFEETDGVIPDPIHNARLMREIYTAADPNFTGRVTVPVLWDREHDTIVNNESREIIRMFGLAFKDLATRDIDLCPEPLRDDIDAALDAIYNSINNGVYRCGFAGSQDAYDRAFNELFEALDHWEGVLSKQRFMCGDTLTEADICMFTTLYRFDPVYNVHFKCNRNRIVDFPNLWGFVRDVYQIPGVADTCNLVHIKQHYYRSHESINPKRIVAAGPAIDYTTPHGRA